MMPFFCNELVLGDFVIVMSRFIVFVMSRFIMNL